MSSPEDKSKENFDWPLVKPGWALRDKSSANILAYRVLAVRILNLKASNEFAEKITCHATCGKSGNVSADFRNNYSPRTAVPVDMISTKSPNDYPEI